MIMDIHMHIHTCRAKSESSKDIFKCISLRDASVKTLSTKPKATALYIKSTSAKDGVKVEVGSREDSGGNCLEMALLFLLCADVGRSSDYLQEGVNSTRRYDCIREMLLA